jgi:hypothetical protein
LARLQIQAIYRESTEPAFFIFCIEGGRDGGRHRGTAFSFGAAKMQTPGRRYRHPGAFLALEFSCASNGVRSSHQYETRISAIADFAGKGKQEKKRSYYPC